MAQHRICNLYHFYHRWCSHDVFDTKNQERKHNRWIETGEYLTNPPYSKRLGQ